MKKTPGAEIFTGEPDQIFKVGLLSYELFQTAEKEGNLI